VPKFVSDQWITTTCPEVFAPTTYIVNRCSEEPSSSRARLGMGSPRLFYEPGETAQFLLVARMFRHFGWAG
jgi:hypothetical protein